MKKGYLFLCLFIVMLSGCVYNSDNKIITPSKRTITNKKIELKEDEYNYIEYNFSSDFTVYFEFENLTSNELEILIFDNSNFEKYKEH